MKIEEHISDRTQIEGILTDVEIEVEHIGGTSCFALEVTERLETAVKEEIAAIAGEQQEESDNDE